MISFTQFYLSENTQDIIVNIVDDKHKWKEVSKDMYDYAKEFLSNADFKMDNKEFKIQKQETGNPKTSKIIDKGMFGNSWKEIKEIIKYVLNYGNIYLMTVANKNNQLFFYISNDFTFTKNSNSSIHYILDYLNPKFKEKQNTDREEIDSKRASEEREANLKAKQEKKKEVSKEKRINTRTENKQLSKKIASELGLEQIGLFKFKLDKITFEAKTKEEAEKKIKESLPDTSPRHGRYGYFDITIDDYNDLTGPKGKFYTNKQLKTKSELGWQTETRTSDDEEFGIGLYYPLKVTEPKLIKGVVYLFAYYTKYLSNTAIMIFDGVNSLNAFNALRILNATDKIGKDEKIRLSLPSQLRWVDERPEDIAPPDTAKTVSKKEEIGSKVEVSTKTKYISPTSKK